MLQDALRSFLFSEVLTSSQFLGLSLSVCLNGLLVFAVEVCCASFYCESFPSALLHVVVGIVRNIL